MDIDRKLAEPPSRHTKPETSRVRERTVAREKESGKSLSVVMAGGFQFLRERESPAVAGLFL
jgi:hypothetical protein